MLRACRDCGDQFEVEPGEFWKIRCLDCWVDLKHAESDSTRRASGNSWIQHSRQAATQEITALRQQIAWLQREVADLRDENQQLLCDLREVVGRLHRAGSLTGEFYEQLPRLLQLCHPDRHGNSLASQRATQWLLSCRSAPVLAETEEVPS